MLTDLDKDHLIIAGIPGDISILFTAQDAYMNQIEVDIPRNCTASEEKENNDNTLSLMQSVMKVNTADFD